MNDEIFQLIKIQLLQNCYDQGHDRHIGLSYLDLTIYSACSLLDCIIQLFIIFLHRNWGLHQFYTCLPDSDLVSQPRVRFHSEESTYVGTGESILRLDLKNRDADFVFAKNYRGNRKLTYLQYTSRVKVHTPHSVRLWH